MSDVPQPEQKFLPYLVIKNAAAAIDFYCEVMQARETMPRIAGPDGKVGHAEIEVCGQVVMISDEHPEYDAISPSTLGGTHITLMLYVDDPEAMLKLAESKGATIERPLTDHFYGDRSGMIRDPFGYKWIFGKRIEALSGEEIKQRADELYGGA